MLEGSVKQAMHPRRERKKPELFVPGKSGVDAESSEAGNKRRGKNLKLKGSKSSDISFEDLLITPEALLQKRISVLYKSGHASEWYSGAVTEFDPDSRNEPFLISFDDGETERGRIGLHTFKSLNKERTYRWLDMDMSRPSTAPEASESSLGGEHKPAISTKSPHQNSVIPNQVTQKSAKRPRGRPRKSSLETTAPAGEQPQGPQSPGHSAEAKAMLKADDNTKSEMIFNQSVEQPSEAAMPSKEQTETGLKAENAQCAVDKVKAGDSRELPKTSNEGTAIGKLVNQQLPKNVSTDKPYHSPTATQAGKTFIGAPHGVYLAGSTQDLSKAQKLADQVKADLESQKQASLGLKVEANELNSMAVGCQSAKLMGTVSNHDESSPVKDKAPEEELAAQAEEHGNSKQRVPASHTNGPEHSADTPIRGTGNTATCNVSSVPPLNNSASPSAGVPPGQGQTAENGKSPSVAATDIQKPHSPDPRQADDKDVRMPHVALEKQRIDDSSSPHLATSNSKPGSEGAKLTQAGGDSQDNNTSLPWATSDAKEVPRTASAGIMAGDAGLKAASSLEKPISGSLASPVGEAQKRKSLVNASPIAQKRLKLDLSANGAGSIKAKRTTSIAAPSSLSILPLAPSRSLAKSASPEEPEEPEYNPEPPPQEMTSEEVEAEVLCNQLESQLRGLSRTRDSIGRATTTALAGAAVGVAPRIIRTIADTLEKEPVAGKRIDMLYLVDSILQGCLRVGKPGCGPGSKAAAAFPKVIAAALPRLIKAVMISQEGLEKAAKVLDIWQSRKFINGSILEPQITILSAAKTAVISATPGQNKLPAAKMAPSSQARGPKASSTVQLMLNAGTESVSAVLEDQYGTHKQPGEGPMLIPNDSSDSDSDDEPDEHEKALRARQVGLKTSALASLPIHSSGSKWDSVEGRKPSWENGIGTPLGSDTVATGKVAGGLNIQLNKRSVSRSNLQDDDRLERAGASDRTFETESDPFAPIIREAKNRAQRQRSSGMDDIPHIPPLPVDESWNEGIPPLPQDSPPLPADEGDDFPPPLPDDLPPLPAEHLPSYTEEREMVWQSPIMVLPAPHMAPLPQSGFGLPWSQHRLPHQ